MPAFPNTVDALSLTPELPGRNGPFRNGSDRYVINVFVDPDTQQQAIAAWKSTDDGATWAEQDSGNRPLTARRVYSACQAADTILVAYNDDSGVGYHAIAFDPSTDTWGTPSATTNPPHFILIKSLAVAYRSADNSILLVLPGNIVGTAVEHEIASFASYDISGNSWSAWTDMDYEDYTNPAGTLTEWDQIPCGVCVDSDGTAHVFMAQSTTLGTGLPTESIYDADDTFTVPDDCTALSAVVIGAGGGGGGVGPGGGGGGGGCGIATNVAVTPGDMIPITVGLGGAQATDGGDSSCLGSTGGGGLAGGISTQDAGGAGGTGDFTGGNGGDAVISGGGGGACANSNGNGGNGADGTDPTGGVGGTPPGAPFGFGGAGGNSAVPPTDGSDGDSPGGGGGGEGIGTTPGTGNGGNGQVVLSYIPNRGSQAGRIWQQAILPDNSLGALAQITDYEIPIQNPLTPVIPLSFDCAAGNGFVDIAVTGVTGVGYDNIALGTGLNADPVVFSFDLLDNGNSGSGKDSSPALAINASDDVYLVYKSVPSDSTVSFNYRKNGGSPVLLGAFNDAGCKISARVSGQTLDIAFGTPTVSAGALSTGV